MTRSVPIPRSHFAQVHAGWMERWKLSFKYMFDEWAVRDLGRWQVRQHYILHKSEDVSVSVVWIMLQSNQSTQRTL